MISMVLPFGVWMGEVSLGGIPARVAFGEDFLHFLAYLVVGRPFGFAGLKGGIFLESVFYWFLLPNQLFFF